MIASFGEKLFQVDFEKVYTMMGVTLSVALNKQTQEVEGKKPSTWVKGPGLRKLKFAVPLKVEFGVTPRDEIDYWLTLAESGKPYPFVIGSKSLSEYNWVLEKVEATDANILSRGQISSAEIMLTFEEYVRTGSKPPSTSPSAPAMTFNVDNVKTWEESNPSEKADMKRVNTNASNAISAGKMAKANRLQL